MPHEDVAERADMPHDLAPQIPNLLKRDEFLRVFGQQYRVATRLEKSRIIDDLVSLTGYHRKHAARLLRGGVSGPRQRFYNESVRDALIAVWEAAGRPGSRRLKKLLPELVPTMERQGELPRNAFLRGKLLMVSVATIDRLLAPVRTKTTAMLLEERLDNFSKRLTELADFINTDDLTPEERQRLKASLVHFMGKLRQV